MANISDPDPCMLWNRLIDLYIIEARSPIIDGFNKVDGHTKILRLFFTQPIQYHATIVNTIFPARTGFEIFQQKVWPSLCKLCDYSLCKLCDYGPCKLCDYAPCKLCDYSPYKLCDYSPCKLCDYSPCKSCDFGPCKLCDYGSCKLCDYAPCN